MPPGGDHQRATWRQRVVANLTRCYPLASGAGSFANGKLVRTLAGTATRPIGIARLRGGERLLVRLDDYVGRAAFFAGDLDPKVTWVCRRVLRPGDTAIDAGANHGVITLRLASAVGSSGRVLAFEPNPAIATLLRQSIELNRATQVTLHAIALGERAEALQLTVPTDNSGKASLGTAVAGSETSVCVPVQTLDEVLSDVPGPIRLMKLDVEGFEAALLRGAAQTLHARPPQVIVLECNDHATPIGEQEVPRLLIDAGYDLFSLPFAWLRPHIARLDLSRPPADDGHELVAIHRSREIDSILRRLRLRPTTRP